jgi:alkylation response protein AidB-like acyl-CoA dehydrogenase
MRPSPTTRSSLPRQTRPQAQGHFGVRAREGHAGFTAADTEHKLGVWAGSTGELFFENVEVPAENLVGEEGQGFEIAMYGLDQGRFTVAAARAACSGLSRAVGRVRRERQTFGEPIGKYQFVQDMIAEMVLGYETSKLLVMQAAWLKTRAGGTRARRHWRSGTRPSRRSRRRTSRSRCTARTGTRPSTGSSATSATRARRSSTRARRRSTR